MSIRFTKHFLCSASFLLLVTATAGYAQTSPANTSQPAIPAQPSIQGTIPGTPDTANAQAADDKDFVHKALQGGAAEVQLGQLAGQKAQSDDVKQFGEKMVQDHSQLADQVMKPLAGQLGVEIPKGLSKKDKELIANLEKLSGPQFDQAYIKAMVKDHKQDLKEFKNEAGMTQDANVKRAAEEGESVIAQHLQMIEQIAQKHDVAENTNGK